MSARFPVSSVPGTPVASPCTSVCRMDAATALCEGCARTIDEIAGWASFTEAQKHAVLERVAQRRAGAADARARN